MTVKITRLELTPLDLRRALAGKEWARTALLVVQFPAKGTSKKFRVSRTTSASLLM
jgi:hypothetical protein